MSCVRRSLRHGLVIAGAVLALPLTVSAQPVTVVPSLRDTTLTVSVTRAGRAPADRASLHFGIESVGETSSAAITRLQEKLKLVLDSVRKASPTSRADAPFVLGVAPSSQNGYPNNVTPVHLARAAVRVNLMKLTDMSTLQLAVAGAGALMSSPPLYESSTIDSVWQSKVTEALAAARASAQTAAAAQGYTLGRMLTMNLSGGPQQTFQQPINLNFDARNSFTQLSVQEVTVTATVGVTYLLVKK
jgi:uncharacterized protein YggE